MDIINSIISLGASVMMPVIFFIIALCFGVKIGTAFKAGMLVGIGFEGVGLVIGLLLTNLGPASQAMVERIGLHLTVVDTGWPTASTIGWGSPLMLPVVKQAGIDPVYFGVLFIMNNAIGLITPPVGIVLNVICGVAKISMDDLMKGLWPFLFAEVVALFAMVLFPELVLTPLKWLL